MRRSNSKNHTKKAQREQEIKAYCRQHLNHAESLINAIETTLKNPAFHNPTDAPAKDQIQTFIAHAQRQIDQIDRRIIQEQRIPHDKKVFSLFESHTEWISKGKAGVPVELGVKVCILEDQYGFILHHRVMEKEQDVDVALDMVQQAQTHFPDLKSCSFDKGFHSPQNQVDLKETLGFVTLPKKGRCNQEERAHQQSAEFKAARKQHSAVESVIHALQVHGLDRCPDHGIDGFKRYVGLAILARNIHKLGVISAPKKKKKPTLH